MDCKDVIAYWYSSFNVFRAMDFCKTLDFTATGTIQEQVDEAIGHGFDGMIVYVDQAEKTPAFYTGGWKDRKNKIPADPKSLFKIASISKLYTAIAVTKLVKERRLFLDKMLVDYLPELKERIENAEEITLKMMVQHRSGIPNFTDNPAFWDNEKENSKDILYFTLDLPASFKPDKGYEYLNTDYL
jgi:CubicO group peptidase (beta-lactamase class C family)